MEFSRLPTNIKPVHYDLSLTPSFETFTFDGQQSVDIIVGFFFVRRFTVLISKKRLSIK